MAGEATAPASLDHDRQLAHRITAGDEAAFDELFHQHSRQVARIAGRFFRRPEVVEDVCQEVFVKALCSAGSYRGEVPLEHWLSRITVNACHDQLRRLQRRKELTASELAEDTSVLLEHLHAPEGAGPGRFWQQEEARLAAEQLLGRLKPKERLLLTLLVLEELPVAEVARLTGWSATNVKVRAFRARAHMRALLTPRTRPAKGR